MAEFLYKALDGNGVRHSDTISADSEQQARAELFSRGLAVTAIQQQDGGRSFSWSSLTKRRISTNDLILFTKQFRTLFSAGIPLVELFKILQNQADNPGFKTVVGDIYRRITEGESLQQAFAAHEKIFSPLYCSMINAGESSGSLPSVLDRLVYILDHEEKVRVQIASAVRYPKIVLAVMAAAFVLLLNYVIPQFATLYQSANIVLPLPTRMAIELNRLFSEYWWIVLAVVAGVFYAARTWFRTPAGVLWKDTAWLRIPVLGPLLQKAVLARFAAIFGILQRSGITILYSMDILKDTVGNAYFRLQFDTVKTKLQGGQGISQALAGVDGFSPLAISLVTVGENAGNLEVMMDELSHHYDEEVTLAVEKMTEYIGPLLIMCLGVIVLFFALAIFMPMWDLVKFV